MTHDEITVARAIAPSRVTYAPGIGTKRFARDMQFLADHSPERELTPKQHKYLVDVAVRFRRQIPREVVALARRRQAELHALAPEQLLGRTFDSLTRTWAAPGMAPITEEVMAPIDRPVSSGLDLFGVLAARDEATTA